MIIKILYIILFIMVCGVGYTLWNSVGPGARRKTIQKRIERIKERKVSVPKTMQESLRRKHEEVRGLLYWLMKPLPDFEHLGVQLERAGKTAITPKRYVLRLVIISLLIVAVISGLFHKPFFLSIPVAAIFGLWFPLKLLKRTINKQNKAFLRLFPEAIDLIVRGLRSGLPVSESLVLVSHEVAEPVGGIFTTVANTMKLGVPMEKALLETAKKLELTEFNFFTTSIILQRETGGNLSEILNNLSEVLRGRYIMQMKIKAMSSEARASSYIIGALPFLVIILVNVITPGYMAPLWYDYRGNICAGIAAFMMGFGMWTMNKMTKFEI